MKLRLTDLITDKISGEWGKEATPTSGVKVIRAANFTKEGVINYDNLVYREIEPSKVDSKRLQFGDIIIEKSGGSPNQPVGRVVFFDLKTSDPFLCNNFTSVLRPNKKLVDPKYLFYRLSDWHKQGKTLRHQNKTTGIINLKLDRYLEEEIEIPVKIEDQIRLANTLDKAQALISQRKESLRLLDEFLKSTFLEMFGDPVKNEKGWKIVPIGDHVDVLTGFAFKSKEYSTDRRGIPLCGGLIIQPDTIEWQKANFWSKDNIRGLDRYFLNQDDVVIAMDRPWISTGFKIRMINKNDPPALLVQRTARLRKHIL